MKKLIGYLYRLPIDSIRYNIYFDNNIYYAEYKNKSYNINLPNEYKNVTDLIHITLFDYMYIPKNITEKQSYITINNKKIKNDNIIDDIFDDITF